mmetsp:Transcript_120423/g.300414  ORF Transcript_120423/g.300414 Transcript_120423/m.300414 type:complete len:201 (+) Transcript_120423:174-776(+)
MIVLVRVGVVCHRLLLMLATRARLTSTVTAAMRVACRMLKYRLQMRLVRPVVRTILLVLMVTSCSLLLFLHRAKLCLTTKIQRSSVTKCSFFSLSTNAAMPMRSWAFRCCIACLLLLVVMAELFSVPLMLMSPNAKPMLLSWRSIQLLARLMTTLCLVRWWPVCSKKLTRNLLLSSSNAHRRMRRPLKPSTRCGTRMSIF